MTLRARYLAGFVLLACVVVLGYGTFIVRTEISEAPDFVLRDLAEINKRLDNMQQSLAQISKVPRGAAPTALKTSSPGDVDRVALPAAINGRLQSIEAELLALWGIAGQDSRPETIEDQPDGIGGILDNHAPPESRTVSMRFEEDGEKSAWSKETESAIDLAYNTTSFTAVRGGDLQTDCRRSICKLEWFIPDSNGLSPEEEDRMLSIARLELVGLASQSASLVGRTHAEFNLSGDRPSLAVFVERKDDE